MGKLQGKFWRINTFFRGWRHLPESWRFRRRIQRLARCLVALDTPRGGTRRVAWWHCAANLARAKSPLQRQRRKDRLHCLAGPRFAVIDPSSARPSGRNLRRDRCFGKVISACGGTEIAVSSLIFRGHADSTVPKTGNLQTGGSVRRGLPRWRGRSCWGARVRRNAAPR